VKLLPLLLAVKLICHSGQIKTHIDTEVFTEGGQLITVQDCQGKYVSLFGDKYGVVPLRYEYQADNFGKYQFWTETPYTIIRVFVEGQEVSTIRTCQKAARMHK